jgi:hypothetical protein
VSAGDVIVAVVVAAALSFDFTNGFHDTANAMATTIATGALRPRVAVAIAAILNFVGAVVSLKVAATVAEGKSMRERSRPVPVRRRRPPGPVLGRPQLRDGDRDGHLYRQLADHQDARHEGRRGALASGFGSEAVAASVILASSPAGFPLSITPVVSGAVAGSGVGRPGAAATGSWRATSSPGGC